MSAQQEPRLIHATICVSGIIYAPLEAVWRTVRSFTTIAQWLPVRDDGIELKSSRLVCLADVACSNCAVVLFPAADMSFAGIVICNMMIFCRLPAMVRISPSIMSLCQSLTAHAGLTCQGKNWLHSTAC